MQITLELCYNATIASYMIVTFLGCVIWLIMASDAPHASTQTLYYFYCSLASIFLLYVSLPSLSLILSALRMSFSSSLYPAPDRFFPFRKVLVSLVIQGLLLGKQVTVKAETTLSTEIDASCDSVFESLNNLTICSVRAYLWPQNSASMSFVLPARIL